jgi:hypothetical protein
VHRGNPNRGALIRVHLWLIQHKKRPKMRKNGQKCQKMQKKCQNQANCPPLAGNPKH